MSDPLTSLIIFALASMALAAVFWPGRGVVPRIRRARRETERVRLEDGMKHLLDRERAGRPGTVETLAGRLEISRGEASQILTSLAEGRLAHVADDGFHLTEAGRAYALRILRTHRLWERYLADRTGVPAVEWHAEAERVEHELSQAEADELAARLGDPRYDPHGDPIPTAGGEIPERAGTALGRVDPGQTVRIRHLEDEPDEVFLRLVEMGLAPGEILEVVDRRVDGDGGAVRIRVGGELHTLRAVDAANVTVEGLAEGEAPTGSRTTLADAGRGETVTVTGLSPACQGPQRRRLLDLGVVPGTDITPELETGGGGTTAYRIRGALIALRREQARWILIDHQPAEKAS